MTDGKFAAVSQRIEDRFAAMTLDLGSSEAPSTVPNAGDLRPD